MVLHDDPVHAQADHPAGDDRNEREQAHEHEVDKFHQAAHEVQVQEIHQGDEQPDQREEGTFHLVSPLQDRFLFVLIFERICLLLILHVFGVVEVVIVFVLAQCLRRHVFADVDLVVVVDFLGLVLVLLGMV